MCLQCGCVTKMKLTSIWGNLPDDMKKLSDGALDNTNRKAVPGQAQSMTLADTFIME